MEKWEGKIAVVTGGSSGMGKATAEKFIENKIKVIVLDINPTDNKDVHFIKCDVSDLNSIKKAFNEIEEKLNFIHILINCAGIARQGNILDDSNESTEKIEKIIDVNFKGVVHVAREAYRLMKKSNDYGLIVNFCSVLGHTLPFGIGFMTYSPTKHAIKAFSEVLRQELITSGDEKVRVTNLSPGTVKTAIVDDCGEEVKAWFSSNASLNPEEIANTILYLLSTPYNVNITELTIKAVGEKF